MTFDFEDDDEDEGDDGEDIAEFLEDGGHYVALECDYPNLGLTDAQMILLSALIMSHNMSWSIH
jgi:hypothetical protein